MIKYGRHIYVVVVGPTINSSTSEITEYKIKSLNLDRRGLEAALFYYIKKYINTS